MISLFKLIGLSKPESFTCELDNQEIFWAQNGLGEGRFNALFNYCNGDWPNNRFAEIEHDGLRQDGTPINPRVIQIHEVTTTANK